MKRFVLIPVLNEASNIRELHSRLQHSLIDTPYQATHYIFIDGGSTDGTQAELESLKKTDPVISIVHQSPPAGLGSAYAQGFAAALQQEADVVVTMDGDLQHRPEDVPRFFEHADKGYDFVLGSRFITEGSIPDDWGLLRRFLSVGGNQIARWALRLSEIHDITSGFALFRIDPYIKSFDFSKLYSFRHAYKVHLLAYMASQNAKTLEIPITFESRSAGESKLITNDISDTLRVLYKLRKKGA